MALKGDSSNKTNAFVEPDEDAQDGFIVRYSAAKAVTKMSPAERMELLQYLYKQGLPASPAYRGTVEAPCALRGSSWSQLWLRSSGR